MAKLDDSSETTTVLVAVGEDSRDYVLPVIRSMGYRALVARTADEMVELASYMQPDLVLMDVLLASGNGLSAVRRLKEGESTARIPILAVTGLASPGDREQCLVAGCDDYLSKPFTPKELAAKVRELLAREQPDDPSPWIEICRVSEGLE